MDGNRDGCQNLFNNPGSCVKFAAQANLQHWSGDTLNVVGGHEISAAKMGSRLRDTLPGDQATRTEPKSDRPVFACHAAQVNEIGSNVFGECNL